MRHGGMFSRRWLAVVGCGVAAVVLLCGAAPAASLKWMEPPPETRDLEVAGVSNDGVVVGHYYRKDVRGDDVAIVFRWTASGGYQELFEGEALGISADGKTVWGIPSTRWASLSVGGRWTETSGVKEFDFYYIFYPLFGNRYSDPRVRAVSADGRVLVGTVEDRQRDVRYAFRWSETGGVEILEACRREGTTEELSVDGILGCSADGSVVIGYSSYPSYSLLWTADGGCTKIARNLYAFNAISGDGRVVVANRVTCSYLLVDDLSREEPLECRYGASIEYSHANAVSYDGRVIVGARHHNYLIGRFNDYRVCFHGEHGARVSIAVRWVNGSLEDLNTTYIDFLVQSGEYMAWLGEAKRVSQNGRFIVGTGDNWESCASCYFCGGWWVLDTAG